MLWAMMCRRMRKHSRGEGERPPGQDGLTWISPTRRRYVENMGASGNSIILAGPSEKAGGPWLPESNALPTYLRHQESK